MNRTIAVVGLVALLSSTLLPATAQYGQKKRFGGTKKYDGRNIKEQETQFRGNDMKRPVSLPGLPQYTGKQVFITGMSYPNAKDGPGYTQTFNVQNTEDQVRTWWLNSLRMSNWKITYSDQKTVRGKMKNGSTCTVSIEPPANTTKEKSKGCRASYTVYYHQVNTKRRR